MISEISPDTLGHVARMTSSPVSSEGASVQESTSEPGRSLVPLIVGVAALALGAALAAVIAARPARPPFQSLDQGWLSVLSQTRDPALTELAKILSLAGGPDGAAVISVAAALYLWLARRRRIAAVFLIAALLVRAGASDLVKHLVLRPRPAGGLVAADVGSFPSGHVMATLAAGIALTVVFARPGRRWRPAALVAAATLVMIWCRTYLGVHWLTDTAGSVLLAAGLTLVAWWLAASALERERNPPGQDHGPDGVSSRPPAG
jgi:membrane-associated phospholipid phosphatase